MKTRRHRPTLAPNECDYCCKVWYGTARGSAFRLCHNCFGNIPNDIYFMYQSEERLKHILAWIADRPPTARHYSSSVPRWMREAIEQGAITLNSVKNVYIVTEHGDEPLSVEVSQDTDKLQPFRIR